MTGAFSILGFGAYLGILFEAKYLKGETWNKTDDPWWKGILRILMLVVMVAPFLVFGVT